VKCLKSRLYDRIRVNVSEARVIRICLGVDEKNVPFNGKWTDGIQ